MRNIQLGSFSLFLGLLAVVFKDGAAVANRGYFSGYSPMVWLCISLHSLGGLAVAMVVKYADNVVRFQQYNNKCRPLHVRLREERLFLPMQLTVTSFKSQDAHPARCPVAQRASFVTSGEMFCHQHLHRPLLCPVYCFSWHATIAGVRRRGTDGELARQLCVYAVVSERMRSRIASAVFKSWSSCLIVSIHRPLFLLFTLCACETSV